MFRDQAKYILTVINSRMDKFGNCYWLVEFKTPHVFFDHGHVKSKRQHMVKGTISANNIRENEANDLGWYVAYIECGIREFDRSAKDIPHFGCLWEDIKKNMVSAMAQEIIKGDRHV